MMGRDAVDGPANPAVDLPDVTHAGIAENAWLVYEMIRNSADFKHGRDRRHDGQPGREWTGSVNVIVDALWPALNDRYLVDREVAQEIKIKLNRYLRSSRNLVCLRNGGTKVTSTWWVSDNWSTLVVTPGQRTDDQVITDAAASDEVTVTGSEVVDSDVFDVRMGEPTPAGSEAPSSPSGDVVLPCRYGGCGRTFTWATGRASHERSHGIRVQPDGAVITLSEPVSSASHATSAVKSAVIRAMSQLEEGLNLTVTEVINRTLELNPTMTRKVIANAVASLIERPWNGSQLIKVVQAVEEGGRVHTRRYHLTRVVATPATAQITAKPAVIPPPAISEPAVVTTERADRSTGAVVGADVLTHAANLRMLLADLGRLAELETGLKASSSKNHELVDKLRAITQERNELVDKLRVATQERDELKAKLDTLKSVFGTALAD